MGQQSDFLEGLNLAVPASYGDFSTQAKCFGEIGFVIGTVSSVEHKLDKFILSFHNHPDTPKWARKFPRQFGQKIEFLEKAVNSWPKCQAVPLFNDSSDENLKWVCLHLKSIVKIRNTLAHGAIYCDKALESSRIWKLTRFQKHSEMNNEVTWVETTTTVGHKALAATVHTSKIIQTYLQNLSRSIEENVDWGKEIMEQEQMRANRKFFGELYRSGRIVKDPWLSKLFGEPDK